MTTDTMNSGALELLALATELNELLYRAADGADAPMGTFSVFPAPWEVGSLIYDSWGTAWSDDDGERPLLDPEDDDSEPIPLRDHVINEMEVLARGILKFVLLARQDDQEEAAEAFEPPEVADAIANPEEFVLPGEGDDETNEEGRHRPDPATQHGYEQSADDGKED